MAALTAALRRFDGMKVQNRDVTASALRIACIVRLSQSSDYCDLLVSAEYICHDINVLHK